jgi:hypothetical protein
MIPSYMPLTPRSRVLLRLLLDPEEGGTMYLRNARRSPKYMALQSRKMYASNDSKLHAFNSTYQSLATPTLGPRRRRYYVPPKRQAFSEIHGVTIQKNVPFK